MASAASIVQLMSTPEGQHDLAWLKQSLQAAIQLEFATIPPYLMAEMVERIPMHRMGQPEEIARVVCFLAQDASGYITGQIWDVDGGMNM